MRLLRWLPLLLLWLLLLLLLLLLLWLRGSMGPLLSVWGPRGFASFRSRALGSDGFGSCFWRWWRRLGGLCDERAGLVEQGGAEAKQLAKSLLRRRGLSGRGAPSTAGLVLPRVVAQVCWGLTGQVRLGRGLGHAGERDCPWGQFHPRVLLLAGRSRTWLSVGARGLRGLGGGWWLSRSRGGRLGRGLCRLGRRLRRGVRGQLGFGRLGRRRDLLLTLGSRCGHVHPQCSLHLTVETQPLLDLQVTDVNTKITRSARTDYNL